MIPRPPTSLNLNVSMSRNRDIITPLNLGTINYTDPTAFSTTQITEILVLDSAIPFQRFAATAPFSLGGNSGYYPRLSEVFPGTDFEDKLAAGGYNKSIGGDPEDVDFAASGNNAGNFLNNVSVPVDFEDWKDLWDRRAALKENTNLAGVWQDAQRNKVTSNWASADSAAFSPQIDVFSRFNKWFTSVTWMVPDSYRGPTSFTWPVLFIYADRVNKILYNVSGSVTANILVAENPEEDSNVITLNGGSVFYFPTIVGLDLYTTGVNVNLKGYSTVTNPELKSTAWKFELLVGEAETVLSTIKQSTNILPKTFSGMSILNLQFAENTNSVRIKVRATSLDPQNIVVESNAIYLATK